MWAGKTCGSFGIRGLFGVGINGKTPISLEQKSLKAFKKNFL
jgi:hypothetical protein